MNSLPEKVRLQAENATLELFPEKSKQLYEKEYSLFQVWKQENKVTENSEPALLAYFSEKAKRYKSSSLWAQFSMLKTTLNIHENVDIGKYCKLIVFLKQRHVGYQAKKSSVFSREEINTFIVNAPDDTFLLVKVAALVALAGGCRCDELVKMCTGDVEDKGDLLLVYLPNTKTHKKRSFTILNNGFGINPIELYRKYLNLRPKNATNQRLFLTYRGGKCTVQPVGINSFGKMSRTIATFLKLKNPESYTGHSFRRSAATLLADCGADILTLKRFEGWKSDNVVQGYVEDSLQQKVKIGKKILGDSTIIASCSSARNDNLNTSSTNSSEVGVSSVSNVDVTISENRANFNSNKCLKLDNGICFHNTNCTINMTVYQAK